MSYNGIIDFPGLPFRKTKDDRFDGKSEQGRNTFAVKANVGTDGVEEFHYGLLYHATVVVWYDPKRDLMSLHTGGYQTYTTKERINWALPQNWSLYQRNHDWFVSLPNGEVVDFEDGMIFDVADNSVVPSYIQIRLGNGY